MCVKGRAGKAGGLWERHRATYHLPRFIRNREKILVLPPRPALLGHLPTSLWRSVYQSLFPQAWPQPNSRTVWSNSKSTCNTLTQPSDRANRTADKQWAALGPVCHMAPLPGYSEAQHQVLVQLSKLAPDRAQHLLPMLRALNTDTFLETRALERPRPLSTLSPKRLGEGPTLLGASLPAIPSTSPQTELTGQQTVSHPMPEHRQPHST